MDNKVYDKMTLHRERERERERERQRETERERQTEREREVQREGETLAFLLPGTNLSRICQYLNNKYSCFCALNCIIFASFVTTRSFKGSH